jgi:predicted adenine nucleotide alpha hydrolase (AANH) superfamily ATPase
MELKKDKVLLHACCAICSGYPISMLLEEGYRPIVYFCNPNLDTKIEFDKRLDAQKTLCKYLDVELIVENYNPDDYLDYVKGFESEPEKGLRCDKCIELRLLKTVNKAKELGIRKISTSLSISPHKNFDKIYSLGNYLTKNSNIEFLDINFKKKDGFLKTNILSRELELYRQNYCGCIFAK